MSKVSRLPRVKRCGGCRRAGPKVRFGPKADVIPMPIPVAHASRLYNRAEEYGHAGSSECCPYLKSKCPNFDR